jgi:hypothetical protein
LLITASVAKMLHGNGFALRLMALNPWMVMGRAFPVIPLSRY